MPKGRRQHICRHLLALLMRLPIAAILTEGPAEYGASDTAGKGYSRLRVVFCGVVAQCRYQLRPRIGVKFFGRRHLGKGRLELGPVGQTAGPGLGHFHQIAP